MFAALLTEALLEPVAGLPPERVAKLVRRSKRTTEAAMAPLVNQLMGVQYLAERDVIVVGADSSFARAWDGMAEIVDLGGDDLAQHDDAASAAARELGRVLAGLGFYQPN